MRERKPNEEVAFIREAYGLRAALFFPVHRMYVPPLAAPKGRQAHPPASGAPPRLRTH